LTSVAAGMGLGVVSGSLTRVAMPGVVFRRVTKMTRSSDHVLVFRKNEGAPVIKAFIAMVRANARRMSVREATTEKALGAAS
jgi:DNA-binding transcriptional LysR family regulator